MTRPCSNDLRVRVIAALDAGESCRAVAARFDVAPSKVVAAVSPDRQRVPGTKLYCQAAPNTIAACRMIRSGASYGPRV